ncbi:MAG: ATP-dependent helicase, partial [Planctomycetes bacterium]|nr:ATP-dependent helicase [Planctomycetota bacterium]
MDDLTIETFELHPEPTCDAIDLTPSLAVRSLPAFERPLQTSVRDVSLLERSPWIRTLGKLSIDVTTQGWRFPSPDDVPLVLPPRTPVAHAPGSPKPKTRVKPPSDMVIFKDRLLYLLQPPLENLFANKQIELPFQPYPYQIKGIAFLMPRHAALLADEMGLGKTAQVIIALRLLFQS